MSGVGYLETTGALAHGSFHFSHQREYGFRRRAVREESGRSTNGALDEVWSPLATRAHVRDGHRGSVAADTENATRLIKFSAQRGLERLSCRNKTVCSSANQGKRIRPSDASIVAVNAIHAVIQPVKYHFKPLPSEHAPRS